VLLPLPPLHSLRREALVRWESAKPILDAVKLPLPENFRNHHVIGVSSPLLVMVIRSSDYRLDDLKNVSTLEMHKHGLARAVIVENRHEPVPTLWFGFPKAAVRIGQDDSLTRFSTIFNGWKIEAKFDPRQMWYRGAESL